MYKNVTEWINANDDIGVLCRNGADVYYSYPIGGEYKEIEAPAFSDDEQPEPDERDDYRPQYETVGWKKLNENMSTVYESKIHLTNDQGETVLCGAVVPNQGDGTEVSGDYGYKECKRCQKKATK